MSQTWNIICRLVAMAILLVTATLLGCPQDQLCRLGGAETRSWHVKTTRPTEATTAPSTAELIRDPDSLR